MSTVETGKKMQKWRTEKEIRKALSNLIHRKDTMCIPPQVDDDDIILMDAIEELLQARKAFNVFITTPFANLDKEQKMAIQEWCDFVYLVSDKP